MCSRQDDRKRAESLRRPRPTFRRVFAEVLAPLIGAFARFPWPDDALGQPRDPLGHHPRFFSLSTAEMVPVEFRPLRAQPYHPGSPDAPGARRSVGTGIVAEACGATSSWMAPISSAIASSRPACWRGDLRAARIGALAELAGLVEWPVPCLADRAAVRSAARGSPGHGDALIKYLALEDRSSPGAALRRDRQSLRQGRWSGWSWRR